MVWTQWCTFREGTVASCKNDFGVYELADDAQNTVYYGSGEIKARLLTNLRKKEYRRATQYRVEYCSAEIECRIKEQQLLQAYNHAHGRLPWYNEQDR